MSQVPKDELLARQATSVRGHSHPDLLLRSPHIEAALARDVSRSHPSGAGADGIPLGFGAFVKALQRLRRPRDAAATP